MSSFTRPLRLEYLDGRRWRLLEPFEYRIGSETSDEIITVPIGFITDFASVPRFFWRLLPPTGPYGKAAVLHDFLYTVQVGKERADDLFLEAMTVLGVPRMTREVMYQAVRWFGGPAYARHSAFGNEKEFPDERPE